MSAERHIRYEDALVDAGCLELTCLEFYKGLFGYARSYLKYGERMQLPVTLSHGGENGAGTWRSVALGDLESFVSGRDDAYVSPCTFFPVRSSSGRYKSRNGSNYADELCAFVLDIDHGGGQNLSFAICDWWEVGDVDVSIEPPLTGEVKAPKPTFVVCSGGGVHLYYVLDSPVSYMKRWRRELAVINNYLYDCFVKPYVEEMYIEGKCEEAVFRLGDIDRHGVVQPYRAVGSLCKPEHGERVVSAWRVGETYSISELAELAGLSQCAFTLDGFDMDKSLLTAEIEASREKASERGKKQDKKRKGWNPGFYRWLLDRELERSRLYGEYGHRYNQVICLSVAAVKDRIGKSQLEEDVLKLYERWNDCSQVYGHPRILWSECVKAMKMYDRQFTRDVRKFPNWWLEEKCGFAFGRQKRNGRNQEEHLKRARRVRLLYIEDGVSDAVGGGRPKGSGTKEDAVKRYAAEHPEANHSEIARALGISRPTVIKWLK